MIPPQSVPRQEHTSNLEYCDKLKPMNKSINWMIIFYVFYFSWLFLLTYLWPDQRIVPYFLGIIIVFYFVLLYEKYDFWFFTAVVIGSYFIGIRFALSPKFVYTGFPPIDLPYWPAAWGLTILALRKFFLTINKGMEQH